MCCAQDETDSKDTNEVEKNVANDAKLVEYNKRESVNKSTASSVHTGEQVCINSHVFLCQITVCYVGYTTC